jgi:hypothetical protein
VSLPVDSLSVPLASSCLQEEGRRVFGIYKSAMRRRKIGRRRRRRGVVNQ